MGLNTSKGNMYEFVTHTWNTIKGTCNHNCSYCYMKRWGKQKPVRFDEKELKTDLGSGNFIFVGSSNDMFAADVPAEWIQRTIDHCGRYDNHYLFQTKNPERLLEFNLPKNSVVCTTIETNRFYKEFMGNSPAPTIRAAAMTRINLPKYITIEPIMDFDMEELVELIKSCNPVQVNIGADSSSQKNGLIEPSKENVIKLIAELSMFTIVKQKKNLKRIVGNINNQFSDSQEIHKIAS